MEQLSNNAARMSYDAPSPTPRPVSGPETSQSLRGQIERNIEAVRLQADAALYRCDMQQYFDLKGRKDALEDKLEELSQ